MEKTALDEANRNTVVDDASELVRTLAASGQQCIACEERAGHKVRRMSLGFGYAGESPAHACQAPWAWASP